MWVGWCGLSVGWSVGWLFDWWLVWRMRWLWELLVHTLGGVKGWLIGLTVFTLCSTVVHCVLKLFALGSVVPIEQLYPQLFTLTGACHEPANFFEKLCARNILKVAYWPLVLGNSTGSSPSHIIRNLRFRQRTTTTVE